jgi:hypothetical protein
MQDHTRLYLAGDIAVVFVDHPARSAKAPQPGTGAKR